METDKKSSANILKAYLRYLKLERNYSPNTLDAYSHDIAWLIDYCKREERDLLGLQLEDLQHFAASGFVPDGGGLHAGGDDDCSACPEWFGADGVPACVPLPFLGGT